MKIEDILNKYGLNIEDIQQIAANRELARPVDLRVLFITQKDELSDKRLLIEGISLFDPDNVLS